MFSAFATEPAAPIPFASLRGPKGLPLLGNALQIDRESFHLQLESLARQWGGKFKFRIGRRAFLVISDPDAVASVLRRRPHVFRKSERQAQVAKDLGLDGVFAANGEDWKRQRRLVMPGLDPTHLHAFLPELVTVTARLRERWMKAALTRRPIHLQGDLMRFTVDVIAGLAFGEDVNTMEQGDDALLQEHLNFLMPELSRRMFAPFDVWHWLPSRRQRRHVKAVREAVQGFIDRTRALLAQQPQLRLQPRNLIQSMVSTCDAGGGLSDAQVAANVLTMLLAGEDTTAVTLSWTIWLLSQHPGALEKARAEVDSVVGVGNLATSMEQLSRLDWVGACADEAMRLKHVTPVLTTQAAEDAEVDGVAVPAGTQILCLTRVAALDAVRFDEPEAFRPERWLQGGPGEAEAARSRVAAGRRTVMPFGAGPRMCPGRYLALAEIKMALAMLLANFDIRDVASKSGGEPRERLMLVMQPEELAMRLLPRA